MKTVEELAREADKLAYAEMAMLAEDDHADWNDVRDRHFRDLVLEEAAKVCSPYTLGQWNADAIRAMKGQK